MDNLPQWNEMLIKLNRDKFQGTVAALSSDSRQDLKDGNPAQQKTGKVLFTAFNSLSTHN